MIAGVYCKGLKLVTERKKAVKEVVLAGIVVVDRKLKTARLCKWEVE